MRGNKECREWGLSLLHSCIALPPLQAPEPTDSLPPKESINRNHTSGNDSRLTSSGKNPFPSTAVWVPHAQRNTDILAWSGASFASRAEVWEECSKHWDRKRTAPPPTLGWWDGEQDEGHYVLLCCWFAGCYVTWSEEAPVIKQLLQLLPQASGWLD